MTILDPPSAALPLDHEVYSCDLQSFRYTFGSHLFAADRTEDASMSDDASTPDHAIVSAIASQYEAALEMLRSAILRAPPGIWDSPEYENRTWRVAYHALWGVRFYLGQSPEVYTPWENAIEGAESLGGSWEAEGAAHVEGVHSVEELLGFLDSLLEDVTPAVASLPLWAPSGFEWYPISRFELHINSIRHTQHHTAQLIERIRAHGVRGIDWVAGAAVK